MNRERRIIVIQPNRKDSKSTASRAKLRVAAYCRVSTEEEEQQGSLKSRNCTTPKKSIPPRSGKSRASTRMTVSPAYIPRSVTVLTR